MRKTPFTDLVGIRVPIIQAPMAGASDAQLAIAVLNAEGLGVLAVRDADACAGSRIVADHQARHNTAGQSQLFLPCNSADRCRA